MSAATWKAFERRVCRLFNAERRGQTGPGGWAQGSDDNGSGPFSIECKRTSRYQLRGAWIEQARRNARATRRPWLLVIAEHNDRNPIAVIDMRELAAICREAGRLPEEDFEARRVTVGHGLARHDEAGQGSPMTDRKPTAAD